MYGVSEDIAHQAAADEAWREMVDTIPPMDDYDRTLHTEHAEYAPFAVPARMANTRYAGLEVPYFSLTDPAFRE